MERQLLEGFAAEADRALGLRGRSLRQPRGGHPLSVNIFFCAIRQYMTTSGGSSWRTCGPCPITVPVGSCRARCRRCGLRRWRDPDIHAGYRPLPGVLHREDRRRASTGRRARWGDGRGTTNIGPNDRT